MRRRFADDGTTHKELSARVNFGAAGAGYVCHTINPRLLPDQIAFIINHAADRVLFIELSFVELLQSIADKLTSVEAVVVMTDAAHMPTSSTLPRLLCYEELLAEQPEVPDSVVFVDELPRTATGKLLKTRIRELYGRCGVQ